MSDAPRPPRPGRLVLVVGPSGAGKDTLIREARARLRHDPRYVFPRRTVTRPPSEAEDNEQVDPETFASLDASGGFLASWSAHGLSYGLPVAIGGLLAEGRIVVCNVSRTVVDHLRAHLDGVRVVAVTAPRDVLAARLAARGRQADGDPSARLDRTDEVPHARVDVTVLNDGGLDSAVESFLAAIGEGLLSGPAADPPPSSC